MIEQEDSLCNSELYAARSQAVLGIYKSSSLNLIFLGTNMNSDLEADVEDGIRTIQAGCPLGDLHVS